MSHVQMNTADSVTQKIHNSSFSGQIDIIHIYLDVQISLQPFTICSHPIKQTSNEIPTYLFKITSHIEVAYTIMAISQMNHQQLTPLSHKYEIQLAHLGTILHYQGAMGRQLFGATLHPCMHRSLFKAQFCL